MEQTDVKRARVNLLAGGALVLETLTLAFVDEFDELVIRGLIADGFRVLNGSVEKTVKYEDIVDLAFRSGKYYNNDLPEVWLRPSKEWQGENIREPELAPIVDAFLEVNGGLLEYLGKYQALNQRIVESAAPLVLRAPELETLSTTS
jgi:hypothetical protein